MMGISAVIRSHATSELARLQNNDTLCYAVQATLKEMVKDGTMGKIAAKYGIEQNALILK